MTQLLITWFLIPIYLSAWILGCASNTTSDPVQPTSSRENEVLQQELDSLKTKISELESTNVNSTIQLEYSLDEAMAFVNDHFEFYDRDHVVKNVKIRKVGYSDFFVSLDECVRQGGCCDYDPVGACYNSVVYELSVSSPSTYTMDYSSF